MMKITPTRTLRGTLRAIGASTWMLWTDYLSDRRLRRVERHRVKREGARSTVYTNDTLKGIEPFAPRALALRRLARESRDVCGGQPGPKRFDEFNSFLFTATLTLGALASGIDMADAWWLFGAASSALQVEASALVATLGAWLA